MTRPATVEIDLAAARHNLGRVRELAPRSRVLAVVKANGYGHGLTRMARAFQDTDAFGVACLEEAEALRAAGFGHRVLLLEGPFSAEELPRIRELDLDLVIHNSDQIAMLEAAPPGACFRIWLKIDTGMHRLGFPAEDVPALHQRLRALSCTEAEIVLMTHFANAHAPDDAMNRRQLERFAAVRSELGELARADALSVANSGATLALPESHHDWVRPGIMLYGISPFHDRTGVDDGLRPVMSVRSKLISVRTIDRGETVGYGAHWRCPERMPVGVAALGYGDGYPRAASQGAPVLVKGVRSRVIGMPSMDMVTVDLRGVDAPAVGDEVVFWGAGLAVEEVARACGTIPYELVAGVRARARYLEVGGASLA